MRQENSIAVLFLLLLGKIYLKKRNLFNTEKTELKDGFQKHRKSRNYII